MCFLLFFSRVLCEGSHIMDTYTRGPPTPRRERLQMNFRHLFIGLAEVAIMDSCVWVVMGGMDFCLFKLVTFSVVRLDIYGLPSLVHGDVMPSHWFMHGSHHGSWVAGL